MKKFAALAMVCALAATASAQELPNVVTGTCTEGGADGAVSLAAAIGSIAAVAAAADPCGSAPAISAARMRELAGLAKCPPGTKFRPLASTNPPETVFFGFVAAGTFSNAKYIQEMARILHSRNPGVKLQVMVLEADEAVARKKLAQLLEGDSCSAAIQVVKAGVRAPTARGDKTTTDVMWMQDVLEFGISGADGRPAVRGFKNEQRDSHLFAAGVAATHGREFSSKGNGEGGNLEGFPGGLTVVGNQPTLSNTPRIDDLEGSPLVVDTKWLSVGHVDELFNVVPTNDPAPCNFAVLYASPAAGLDLLSKLDPATPMEPDFPLSGNNVSAANPTNPDCIRGMPRGGQIYGDQKLGPVVNAGQLLGCDALVMANRDYENRIRADAQAIALETGGRTGCRDVKIVPLPQIFRPKSNMSNDYAGAVNPNVVNGLVVDKTFVLARQPNDLFASEVESRLEALGVRVEFVDGAFYHYYNGSVHCSTNAIRTCSKPDAAAGTAR